MPTYVSAERSGSPTFRVALPTYGYLLAFDAAGKFIAVAAEGPQRPWPNGTRLRVVRADAGAMAGLSRALEAEPPPHWRGVIWFRLPVASDRHNWDAITFAAVLRGEEPRRNVRVRAAWSESGLAEIMISNDGQTTEPLPATVRLTWPAGERLLASDGLAGFVLEMRAGEAQGILRAANVPADASLAPGRNATIAWLRFAHEISLDVIWPVPP